MPTVGATCNAASSGTATMGSDAVVLRMGSLEVAKSATGASCIAVAAAEDCTAVAIAVVNRRDMRWERR